MARPFRGVAAAVAAHRWGFVLVSALIASLSVLLPPLVLSIARKPADYFTFNPWLKRLPEYLASTTVPIAEKLRKVSDLAVFWVSADSPMGGTEWGFAVDVKDAARILLTALLFGAYFSLWRERRHQARDLPRLSPAGPSVPAAGALMTVVGLSTGPCSVMGCGAPVLPVIGLAFAGLSSVTLQLLAILSSVATALVIGGLALATLYLGWVVGGAPPAPARRRVATAGALQPGGDPGGLGRHSLDA